MSSFPPVEFPFGSSSALGPVSVLVHQVAIRELGGKTSAISTLRPVSRVVGVRTHFGRGDLVALASAVMVLVTPARQVIRDLIAKTTVDHED